MAKVSHSNPELDNVLGQHTKYALKYFAEPTGKPLYVAGLSAIGPFTSDKPEEALSFDSKREAMQHPAWSHPTLLCDIVEHPLNAREEIAHA